MLKKCQNDKVVDFELYKLNYNNSSVAGLNYSLAQILMSRKLRSKIPYKIEDIKPKVICNDAHKFIMKQKIKLTEQYNKTSVNRSAELRTGNKVWVQDMKTKLWNEGGIVISESITI